MCTLPDKEGEKLLVCNAEAQFFMTLMKIKKRTVILTRNLWNYKTTGIRQSPSVQIMKVHCMGVQFNVTEGCPAIISTIIPGFQPTKNKKKKTL